MRVVALLLSAAMVAACGADPVTSSPATSSPATSGPVQTSAAQSGSARPSPVMPSPSPIPAATSSPTPSPTPAPPALSTPGPNATPSPTPAPSATPASTASPTPTPDPALVKAAVAYARKAGFDLASDPRPKVRDEEPAFYWLPLHRVSLRLAHTQGARLKIYIDDDRSVRVVEGGWDSQSGPAVSRAEVFRAARRALRQVGVDPGSGTLHVAAHIPRSSWYLTFDRTIAGYPVANWPMAWGLDGDKAYLELRADGTLRELYAIRLDHRRVPTILDRATLDRRLAKVAKVSRATLVTYEPGLLWVRAYDPPTGHIFPKLRLSYCATHRSEDHWVAWCVDAGTGAFNARGEAWD